MNQHFRAYGLTIDSELPLVELQSGHRAGEADVTIRLGKLDAAELDALPQAGPVLRADNRQLLLEVPEVARFLVSDGSEICIEPADGIDEDSIRLFLLGSALGALLMQRGLLLLHGNAVRIGEHCLVCVGDSGAGKSTLAAGFMQRGYEVLADDIVPVDGEGLAIPGYARIKLWRDVADRLDIDTSELRRIRPELEKYNLPLPQLRDEQPVPVKWVYILHEAHVDEVEIEHMRGMDRLRPLVDNTYRLRFARGMGLRQSHFQQCAIVGRNASVARVRRPRHGFRLDELIDRLLQDLAEHP